MAKKTLFTRRHFCSRMKLTKITEGAAEIGGLDADCTDSTNTLSVMDTDDDTGTVELMDLRVDYAFKLLFATGDTKRLISLLNAIFANKRIPRLVTSLTVVNPFIEKASLEDKLSVLDIRAKLADGTTVCIEMHLYDLLSLKHKMLRSWARAYGEDLTAGRPYIEQNTAVCIAFMNGAMKDVKEKPIEKEHSLFGVMERDSHETLLDDMEMHFIDMQAFVRHLRKSAKKKADIDAFTKWLIFINQSEITEKKLRDILYTDKEMSDAMKTLTQLSRDKVKRQAYQRRLDELHTYNRAMKQLEEYKAQIAVKDAVIADKDAVIANDRAALADKDAALADKDATIADKDAAIAEKDALIAKLMVQKKQS